MSRHDNWEAEDGMGFAGLVPTLAEKRREQEEERERELIAALRESLASAQRGKEAAERELDECQRKAAFDDALCKVQKGLIDRLQDEIDDWRGRFGYPNESPEFCQKQLEAGIERLKDENKQLQQERDRLAARLDAAEKVMQAIRLDGCYPGREHERFVGSNDRAYRRIRFCPLIVPIDFGGG